MNLRDTLIPKCLVRRKNQRFKTIPWSDRGWKNLAVWHCELLCKRKLKWCVPHRPSRDHSGKLWQHWRISWINFMGSTGSSKMYFPNPTSWNQRKVELRVMQGMRQREKSKALQTPRFRTMHERCFNYSRTAACSVCGIEGVLNIWRVALERKKKGHLRTTLTNCSRLKWKLLVGPASGTLMKKREFNSRSHAQRRYLFGLKHDGKKPSKVSYRQIDAIHFGEFS